MEQLKIIVGAGNTWQDGWLSLKESDLDIANPYQWAELFEPNSIDAIVAEHVWEHLTLDEGWQALLNCYRYLKRGGTLRIAVPDGFHGDPHYINWVAPGVGYNGDDHKVLYNVELLGVMMSRAGFTILPCAFFDLDGRFYQGEIDPEYGRIRRTAGSLHCLLLSIWVCAYYTSLVIDGIKL
jgi:predicted SAM-dependent methyltransferase